MHPTIAAWADMQTAPWRDARGRLAEAGDRFERLNATLPDIFLFDFDGGAVEIRAKPHYSALELAEGALPLVWRAQRYREFFEQVAGFCGLAAGGTVAMTMDDYSAKGFEAPVFAFQKRAGSNQILVPDIDAIRHDFYERTPPDVLDYSAKRVSAVFVGSTTGAMHSVASVAALSSQRLRSGVYFRGVEGVDFRLPQIVQCLAAEAEAAIRALGFGVGAADWGEQLGHRFLISMDGNGATCSRMALGLRSNSVLLKYASPYQLYYFAGLDARRQYVPITDDGDVSTVLGAERACPGLYRRVAEEGRRFFEAFLTRGPSMAFTGAVLERYFDCFRRNGIVADRRGAAKDHGGAVRVLGTAHVSHRGDRAGDAASGLGEGGLAIEGFSLVASGGLGRRDLEYRAIGPSGEAGDWRSGGAFAGTRGLSQPLTGFAARLSAAAAAHYDCRCWAGFEDSSEVGPLREGECRSPGGSALTWLRITIDAACR